MVGQRHEAGDPEEERRVRLGGRERDKSSKKTHKSQILKGDGWKCGACTSSGGGKHRSTDGVEIGGHVEDWHRGRSGCRRLLEVGVATVAIGGRPR